MTTHPISPGLEQELAEEPCISGENQDDQETLDEPDMITDPPSIQSGVSSVILPPSSDIQKDDAVIDQKLIRKGDHSAYDDVQILNAMTGRVPTSLKLHIIRDAWDALVWHDLSKTKN